MLVARGVVGYGETLIYVSRDDQMDESTSPSPSIK